MKTLHLISYVLLGLNQYRLILALNQNTSLMGELNRKLVESECNANILQKKCDLLESSLQEVKPIEVTTFLQNHGTLCLILGLCGALALVYIGIQCTPSIVQGTDNWYKTCNEVTKNLGEAGVGAINRFSGALDIEHIEELSTTDCYGTTIILRPVPDFNGYNLGYTGLYIKLANSDQDIFIQNISELYRTNLELQDLTMPTLEQETIQKRLSELCFDL